MADLYATTTVRGRWVFVAVEVFSLVMSVDILWLLNPKTEPISLISLGIMRLGMTVGVAWVAWTNMRIFQRMRKL